MEYKQKGGSIEHKALVLDTSSLDIINLQKGVWKEELHPRAKDGKFGKKSEASVVKEDAPKKTATKKTEAPKKTATKKAEEPKKKTATKKAETKATARTTVKKAPRTKEAAPKTPPIVSTPTGKKAPRAKKTNVVELPKPKAPSDLAPDFQNLGRVRTVARRVGDYAVPSIKVNNHEDVARVFADLADSDREKTYVMAVKNREIVGVHCTHIGNVNSSIVDPKDMLKVPILSGADTVYIVHNHPTGHSTPSKEDEQATIRFRKAANELGIGFGGHVIIGDNNYTYLDTAGNHAGYGSTEKESLDRKESAPVYETYQEKNKDIPVHGVTSPDDVFRYITDNLNIKDANKAVYIIGTDNKNYITHAEPLDVSLPPYELRKQAMKSLITANSVNFFMFTGLRASASVEEIGIKDAASAIHMRLLDVITPFTHDPSDLTPGNFMYQSYANMGILSQVKSLYIDLQKAMKSITRTEAKKVHKDLPEGGTWRTIHGHHIYIKDGKVLAGSIPGATGAKKATKAHLAEHQATINAEAKKSAPRKAKKVDPKSVKLMGEKGTSEDKKAKAQKESAKVRKEIDALAGENAKRAKKPPKVDPEYMAKQRKEVDKLAGENAKKKIKKPTLEEQRAEAKQMLEPPTEAKRATDKVIKRKGVEDIRTEKQKDNEVAYDVGKKIGGARKDEAAMDKFLRDLSGQSLQDIEKFSSAQAQKLCTKKNIVKPVDFEAERKRGVEINVAMTKALLYERIAPKPAGDSPEERQQYLHAIQNLQRQFEPIKTWDEFKAATLNLREWIRNEEQSDVERHQRGVDRYTEMLKRKPTEEELTRSKYETEQNSRGKWQPVRKEYKISEADWRKEQESRLKMNKDALALAKKANASPYKPLGEKLTNFFTKLDKYTDGSISNSTIKTVEAKNLSWDTYFKSKPASEEKKPTGKEQSKQKWEKEKPAVVKRSGGRNTPVQKPEDMKNTFNFKGIEFGNWIDDASGKFHMVKCAEAFHDLADILKIKDKDVSLNGRLAMAFGARGKGKALAHYEPLAQVINITKEGGAGSLAHEWGHAMDNMLYMHSTGHTNGSLFFGSDGYMGDKGDSGVKASYDKLMDAILRGDGSGVDEVPYTGLKGYTYHKSFQQAVETLGMKDAVKKVAKIINDSYDRQADYYKKDSYGDRNPDYRKKALDKIERKRKRDINAMAQEMGYHHEKLTGKAPESVPVPNGMSQYYTDSKNIGGNTDYWLSHHEMFARAFETYVEGKMKTGKVKNDYLVHGAWYGSVGAPYPRGEERDAISKAFDELMENVRKSDSIKKALEMLDLEKGLLQSSRANSIYQAMKAEVGTLTQQNRNAYSVVSTEGVFFIPVNRLKCAYQTEKALNFDKVRSNVERMKNGENLEPVVIGYDYDVHDGHHRIEASKIMKYTHIPCIVGGSNPIHVQRAQEAYREVWKSIESDIKDTDLAGEKQAILDYSERIKQLKDPKVKKVIAEILKDEKNHQFNLKKVLAYLEGDKSALDSLQKSFDPEKHPRDAKGEFTEVYHLTSDKDFKYDPNYKNTKQEMGAGLYTTPLDDAHYWERALQDEKGNRHPYAIPIDLSEVKLLHHGDVPNDRDVAKHLMKHYGSPKEALKQIDTEQKEISGDILGNDPFRIAQHRLYVKTKGYDGLIMHDDREGHQVVLFNADRANFKPAITTDELFDHKRKKDFGVLDVKSLNFDLQKGKKFDETKHPRDRKGEFTKKGSERSSEAKKQKSEKPLYSSNEGTKSPKTTKGADSMQGKPSKVTKGTYEFVTATGSKLHTLEVTRVQKNSDTGERRVLAKLDGGKEKVYPIGANEVIEIPQWKTNVTVRDYKQPKEAESTELSLPKKMSATNAKKHMGGHGVPAGHREALLQTLEHKTTVNHFRPGEDGFEVQGSKEVVGREYQGEHVQGAIDKYKKDKKFASKIAKASEGINKAEKERKAKLKAEEKEGENATANMLKQAEEQRKQEDEAKAASEEYERRHPNQAPEDFDPLELLMIGTEREKEPEKPETKKETQYHIATMSKRGKVKYVAVDGKKINVGGKVHAFIHGREGAWTISEARTGLKITSDSSKTMAIKTAKYLVESQGVNLRVMIQNHIARHGESPTTVKLPK